MSGWNHNIYYYDLVVKCIPPHCGRACDVGCGRGVLARKLVPHCEEVVAIDAHAETLALAREAGRSESRIAFVEGDAMTYPFPGNSFDLISSVASLHHLSLLPALQRFRNLLRPGGVLVIIGLYREKTVADYALAAVALPASWIMRCVRGSAAVTAPLALPKETLSEIRAACNAVLPGAEVKRRLFFRYSLIWTKP